MYHAPVGMYRAGVGGFGWCGRWRTVKDDVEVLDGLCGLAKSTVRDAAPQVRLRVAVVNLDRGRAVGERLAHPGPNPSQDDDGVYEPS